MATPTAITGSQLITDSLRLLNVIRANQTPAAEQLQQGVRALNEMMSLWEADGKQLGYIPIGTATDVLTVQDGAIIGMKASLAIVMAPFFGTTVSQEVLAMANTGIAVIDKITAKEVIAGLDLQLPADRTAVFSINNG